VKKIAFTLVLGLLLGLLPTGTVMAAPDDGTIDGTHKYAWGENTGWINFGTTGGDVHVLDYQLTGYAWVPNYGWINLNPTTAGVTNDGEGTLGGHAWGENLGWVDFTGVVIDDGGYFTGYATNPIAGQISFSCLNGVSSCATGEFKVRTDWRPRSVRGADKGATPLPKYLNPEDEDQPDPESSYVYRFWSDVFRGHFFTIDADEAERVKNFDSNWRYEKVAFNGYIDEVDDSIPLYRFWSDVFRGHFYTADYEEYKRVKDTDSNWNYEWVAYYVYPMSYDGPIETETVYRFWSPVFLHHFYTADYDEMVKVRDTDSNWTYEGPAYQVPAQQFEGCDSKSCSQMVSCQEAQYYYSQCGLTDLDSDGDGMPCPNVCGG